MKLYSILFLLLFSNQGFSQYETWLEGRVKAGFLVAHRSIMGHLANEHAYAGELSYFVQGKGRKAWHEAYKYPTYGVTGFFGTVGNRELMGHYFGAFGFMSFPLLKVKHYTFSGKVGCGVGYGTKVHDPEDNKLSIAVSTHFNVLVSLAVENRWVFGRHAFNTVIDMTHFSNGATKVPNLGLNLPYVSIGYGYKLKDASRDTRLEFNAFKKRWEFGAIALGSTKEVFPAEGEKYPVFGLNAVARRYFKRNVAMEMSFDFISKQAVKAYQSDVPKTQAEIVQLGLFAGYILPLDHFHLVVGMGYYVKDKFQPEDFMYHRVGMRYVFNNGLNINLALKTHWARADYIEYGIGYTFKR